MDAELARLVAVLTASHGGQAVVRAPSALEGPLVARLQAAGWAAALVDRAPVFSRETLLHAAYQACELPAWFGFNWDALLDALSTWSTRPGTLGGVLLFRDLGLLEERDPEAAATFLDVLRDAREARHAPLRLVLLEGPGRAAT